jgi:SBF-like CPA transporter family (DUF4137)
VCILLLVWTTFCDTFADPATAGVPGRDVAAVIFLCAALFALFAAICFAVAWPPLPAAWRPLWLDRRDTVAVMICGSTKTVALGVPLLSVMFADVRAAGLLALPLIVYHALQILLGGLLLGRLRAWCLNDDKRGVVNNDDTAAAQPVPDNQSEQQQAAAAAVAAEQGEIKHQELQEKNAVVKEQQHITASAVAAEQGGVGAQQQDWVPQQPHAEQERLT